MDINIINFKTRYNYKAWYSCITWYFSTIKMNIYVNIQPDWTTLYKTQTIILGLDITIKLDIII